MHVFAVSCWSGSPLGWQPGVPPPAPPYWRAQGAGGLPTSAGRRMLRLSDALATLRGVSAGRGPESRAKTLAQQGGLWTAAFKRRGESGRLAEVMTHCTVFGTKSRRGESQEKNEQD